MQKMGSVQHGKAGALYQYWLRHLTRKCPEGASEGWHRCMCSLMGTSHSAFLESPAAASAPQIKHKHRLALQCLVLYICTGFTISRLCGGMC